MKRVAILGSTGSIGQQTLDVIRAFPGRFQVVALCAGNNVELLEQQIDEFKPKYFHCSVESMREYGGARRLDPHEVVCLSNVDLVMLATVGCAGMGPAMSGLRAGKTLALANKEVVVMAGQLLLAESQSSGGKILPVDSEPSAIWQCLEGEQTPPSRLILTASGGAFRDRTWQSLATVTPAEALKHPTWTMGQKITIDAASMMNKAFEVIEMRWLFDFPFDQIDVVIHRQSIIHSLVEFVDGSMKAQLGPHDMRNPIQYAMFYPKRQPNESLPKLDLVKTGALTFEDMNPSLYPCFELALEYGRRGGTWPSVLAGADEAAVALFLSGKIRFTDLPDAVEATLAAHRPIMEHTVEDAIQAASWATEKTLARYGAI